MYLINMQSWGNRRSIICLLLVVQLNRICLKELAAMFLGMLLTILSAILIASSADRKLPPFTAIAPKIIYPGTIYSVNVFIEPSTKTPKLQVQAKIVAGNTTIASKEASIRSGHRQVIPLRIKNLKSKVYNLTIIASDNKGNTYENNAPIFATFNHNVSIFIQTDKPIYKPGDVVKYRIILLDYNIDLKPAKKDRIINVKIRDSQYYVISYMENVVVSDGFYKSELQLSTDPDLGSWSIEVILGPHKASYDDDSPPTNDYIPYDKLTEDPIEETLSFQVSTFDLQTYGVNIILPSFITKSALIFPVTVSAMYTYPYSKAVVGSCSLVITRAYLASDCGTLNIHFPINGSHTFDVNINGIFHSCDPNNDYYYEFEQTITFDVTCTDKVTGKVMKGENTVYMYTLPYRINQISSSSTLKPGLPYTTIFQITNQDNVPIRDSAPDALKITDGFSCDQNGSSITLPIPENGLVRLTFRAPSNTLIQPTEITITYKELFQQFYIPSYYNSEGSNPNGYMEIQLAVPSGPVVINPVQIVNSPMTVNVQATVPFKVLNYLIQGRQQILSSGQVELDSPVLEYNLTFNCPDNADPTASIIVYTILKTDEFLVDSVEFNAMNDEPDNFLNIQLSENTTEPGDNVTLTLTSRKGSLLALRGVDQNVMLMGEDNDITQSTLDHELFLMGDYLPPWSYNYYSDVEENYLFFDTDHLVVVTNAKLHVPSYTRGPMYDYDDYPQNPFEGGFGQSYDESYIQVQSDIPNTWIWTDVGLKGNSTVTQLTETVPVITSIDVPDSASWIITGYSLNPNFGIGFSQQAELVVFRPFFISLVLPYSVVKGEVLYLQVLVHNHLGGDSQNKTTTTAQITLDNSQHKFKFVDPSFNGGSRLTKSVKVAPNSVSSVYFAIVPATFGFITLTVKGITPTAGDTLSQQLRVIPSGQRIERSTAVLLNPSQNASDAVLTAIFPGSRRVQQADEVKLFLYSDILERVFKNFNNLLALPLGCGEQNMLPFAVDIAILNYFNTTGKLKSPVKSRVIEYLKGGYQRQLVYRNNDGSFSAFYNRYLPGSTWLTALACRYLIQAKQYITIYDPVITGALDFLVSQQKSDGRFKEQSPIYLQSTGTTGGVALSAFVCLTLLEANNNGYRPTDDATDDYSKYIDLSLNFITNQVVRNKFNDVYAIVLAAYAVNMANYNSSDALFAKMLSVATTDESYTYWESKPQTNAQMMGPTQFNYPPWGSYIQPVTIEMTSYALLTFLRRGNAATALPIVRWLVSQQNSNGGFSSTQDTAVAITALAEYAAITKSKVTNLKVNFKQGNDNKRVSLTDANAQVLQQFPLPMNTSSLPLSASGQGSVVAQLTWAFYVLNNTKTAPPAFNIAVDASKSTELTLKLKVCISYIGDKTQSNMVLAVVNLPSGFTIDSNTQNFGKVKRLVRYDLEISNTQLDIYFSSLSKNSTCFNIEADRTVVVDNLKEAYISVVDYYDTTQAASVFYDAPPAGNSLPNLS